MRNKMFYMDHYPIANCYQKCRQFLYKHINWGAVSTAVQCNRAVQFDVSDCIALFPHLELDEKYTLLCYVTSEYHGLWGRVAAVPQEQLAHCAPILKDDFFAKLTHGPDMELPKIAAPPMDAIYCDGTPNGYLEALLCEQLVHAIPYAYYEHHNYDTFITEYPNGFKSGWDIIVDIRDLTPRVRYSEYGTCTVTAFTYVFENGFGSSDGRDRIYLSEYAFYDRYSRLGPLGMYQTRIEHHNLPNSKYVCTSKERSVLIARQKRNLQI